MRILSFPVFSSQFNLNNTDGEATNKITPIVITSIDKIINTFIFFLFPYSRSKLWPFILQHYMTKLMLNLVKFNFNKSIDYILYTTF